MQWQSLDGGACGDSDYGGWDFLSHYAFDRGGELYQQAFAQGKLDVWGNQKIAIECEGEHAAQGGATAFAVTGKRAVNFTSGQGIAYAMEQYYHAPGKLSTMVLEVQSA